MNSPDKDELLLNAFKSAATGQETPDGPHVVDDDEQLISWSLGEIDARRQSELRDHLADCPYCRKELAAMIRAGALKLPPVEAVVPVRRFWHRRNLIWATAAAATLMIGIVWTMSDNGSQRILAMVEKDLGAGNPAAAMDRVETLLDEEELDANTRQKAQGLLEESGYRLARKNLRSGDFQEVLDVEHRTAERGLSFSRLSSLRLQAERGIPAEHALTQSGNLLDYGYELSGQSYNKGAFPTFDETTQRIRKELAEAVKKYPDSLDLRLNYAQLLLEENEYKAAEEQFNTALRLDEKNALAHVGLGLVRYHREQHDDALKSFVEATALDPTSFDAQLNTAICLERIGRSDEAIPYWRKANELTGDTKMKRRIKELLSAVN